jgi:hypothetical protein
MTSIGIPSVPAARPPSPRSSLGLERIDTRGAAGAGRRIYLGLLVGTWIGVAGYALVLGLAYYLTPLAERAYSPLHEAFRPAGDVGRVLGLAGSLMMLVGVALYGVRKRFGFLRRLGKLKYWLEIHIFLCTLGPFLVLLHTSFRIGGVISIAFWSMIVVVASGFFGRYVYTRIPKTINGRFLTLKAVQQERDRLVERLSGVAGLTQADLIELTAERERPQPRRLIGALIAALRLDLAKRREIRRLRRIFQARKLSHASRESLEGFVRTRFQLEQQMALLLPFQRLFRYWHLLHLPLAIVMLLVVVVHLMVAALFGYL